MSEREEHDLSVEIVPASSVAESITRDMVALVADGSLPETALDIAWCEALATHMVEGDEGVEEMHELIHAGAVGLRLTFDERHEVIAQVLDAAGIDPLFCTEDDDGNMDMLTEMWELPAVDRD